MSGSDDLFDFAHKRRYPEKRGHKAGGTSANRCGQDVKEYWAIKPLPRGDRKIVALR